MLVSCPFLPGWDEFFIRETYRVPGLETYKKRWKDPPCYQWVNRCKSGKSTISTGPFSIALCNKLAEGIPQNGHRNWKNDQNCTANRSIHRHQTMFMRFNIPMYWLKNLHILHVWMVWKSRIFFNSSRSVDGQLILNPHNSRCITG